MSRLVKLTGEKMLTFSWIRTSTSELDMPLHLNFTLNTANATKPFSVLGWLDSRVVSVLDSGAEGPGFQLAVATLSGNSLTQTVHTHYASVYQAAKLVAALLRLTGG